MPNRTLLARLERAWAQSLGAERDAIGDWLNEFSAILAGQESTEIAGARQRLIEALDDMRY
ncbi:hypothetical protein D3C85_1814030 [compost metagenome]